jgi:uncharacterized membrane protein
MSHAIHSSRPAGVERATAEPGGRPRRRREIVKSLSSWAAAIAAAALGFWLTEGTSWHQLAIALLTVLVTLAVALALLEGLWRLLAYAFGSHHAGRRRARPGGD